MATRHALVASAVLALGALLLLIAACTSGGGELDLDDVPQDGATLGDAGIEVKLYENLFCETCRDFSENVLPKLIDDYVKPGKIHITFVGVPLGTAPEVFSATEAAYCAGDQSQLWEYAEVVVGQQGSANYTDQQLKAFADDVGLDRTAFDTCLDDGKYEAAVQAGLQQFEALASKQLRLPVVDLNDIIVMAGSTDYDDVKLFLDDELESQ
jgi:hypothetical protein